MQISTLTGNENFQSASAKVHVFFVPSSTFPGAGSEHHIATLPGSQIRVLRTETETATEDPAYTRDFGVWYHNDYDVPEGALFKLYVTRTRPNVQPRTQGGTRLFRARESAPLIRVDVDLTGDARARYAMIPALLGRFDEVTLDEAEADGATFSFREMFDPAFTAPMVHIAQVAPGVTARPMVRSRQIVNAAGDAVVVQDEDHSRDLDV